MSLQFAPQDDVIAHRALAFSLVNPDIRMKAVHFRLEEKRHMIDPNHPFYDATWRRVLIPVVCFVWVCIELYAGEAMWAGIVGVVGLFATYKLFFDRKKPEGTRPPERQED